MEKNASARIAWNMMKNILWRRNRSAKPPKRGFATKPDIGSMQYINPTKIPEKPNCFAINGKNMTSGPVPLNFNIL